MIERLKRLFSRDNDILHRVRVVRLASAAHNCRLLLCRPQIGCSLGQKAFRLAHAFALDFGPPLVTDLADVRHVNPL